MQSHNSTPIHYAVIIFLVAMSLGCNIVSTVSDLIDKVKPTPTPMLGRNEPTPGVGAPVFPVPTTTRQSQSSNPNAEDAKKAYLQALRQKEFQKAAALISTYSLQLAGETSEKIRRHFEKKDFDGWKLIDYRIVESKVFNNQTVLVRVFVKEQTGNKEPQSYDYWAAVRQENGQWRVNWNAVIDDVRLQVQAQTINGLTIQPVRMIRTTEQISLYLNIKNTNQRGIFWGWVGETITTFYFGNQTIDIADKLYIEPNRTYPDVYVNVGEITSFPTSVVLQNWQWASKTSSNLPEPMSQKWSYSFQLK